MGRRFTPSQRLLLLKKAGYRCFLCGVELTPDNFAADHYIPYSKGGATQAWNGKALCHPCNTRKSNLILEDGDR